MIIPSSAYPGHANGATSAYPQGSARNITTPGDGTGFPLDYRWVNDLLGFFQAVVARAGVTPNGNPESVLNPQILNALLRLRWMQYADALTTAGSFDGDSRYIFWPREETGPLLGGPYLWAADATDAVDTTHYSVIAVTGVSTGRWLRFYDRRWRDGVHEPLVALASEVSGVLPTSKQWAIIREFDITWGGFSNTPSSHCVAMQTEQMQILVEGTSNTYVYKKYTKLVIQGFSANTSNSAVMTGGNVPAAFRPARDAFISSVALVGTSSVPCMIALTQAEGAFIALPFDAATGKFDGGFPTSGVKGISGDFTFFYET